MSDLRVVREIMKRVAGSEHYEHGSSKERGYVICRSAQNDNTFLHISGRHILIVGLDRDNIHHKIPLADPQSIDKARDIWKDLA